MVRFNDGGEMMSHNVRSGCRKPLVARGFFVSMKRSLSLLTLILVLNGCGSRFTYELVTASRVREVSPDSLKWTYTNGLVTEIAVRDEHGDLLRLPVDPETQLHVTTTERDEHYFRLQSIVVEDKGEGLLGSTTSWRGYDTRQGVERSVMIREVTSIKVLSRIMANRRISTK
jgi:hypothetical protein